MPENEPLKTLPPNSGEALIAAGFEPVHPGTYFLKTYIKSGELTESEAGAKLGLSSKEFFDFISGSLSVKDDLAGKLAQVAGVEKEFWISMQAGHDFFTGWKKTNPTVPLFSM